MALSDDQLLLEHEARMEQMTVNVEKMRSDMRMEDRKFRLQTWTIFLQVVGLTIGAFAAGVAAASYLRH